MVHSKESSEICCDGLRATFQKDEQRGGKADLLLTSRRYMGSFPRKGT